MDIGIYKTYSFDFDKKTYVKEFRDALKNAGVKTYKELEQLFEKAGVSGYKDQTIKSFFYGRRVLPFNVFIAVCKYLHLSIDKMAFPQSIQDPKYDKDILDCEYLFRNIFYPYNYQYDDKPVNLTEFFNAETYKSDVDKLALVLVRFNYLIQKYHYVDVSNDELRQIGLFTERYIIDRDHEGATEWQSVRKWIKDCKSENFLNAFYDKYTLGFYSESCKTLLNGLSAAISSEFISYAKGLFPFKDVFGWC